jgi:hypothetical protein
MFRASALPEDGAPVDPHTLRLNPVHWEMTVAQVSTFPVRQIEPVPATAAQFDPALHRSQTQQPRKPKSKQRACPAVQATLFLVNMFG